MADLVEGLNGHDGDEDWWDGPLPRWLSRFGTYSLVQMPLDDLDLDEHAYDPGLAAEYAAMDPHTMPPLVYDPVSRSIVDGNHRVQGARLQGDTAVAVYVGDLDSVDGTWKAMD